MIDFWGMAKRLNAHGFDPCIVIAGSNPATPAKSIYSEKKPNGRGGKGITWLLFLAGCQARKLGLMRDLPDAAESSYKLIFLKIFDIIYM